METIAQKNIKGMENMLFDKEMNVERRVDVTPGCSEKLELKAFHNIQWGKNLC